MSLFQDTFLYFYQILFVFYATAHLDNCGNSPLLRFYHINCMFNKFHLLRSPYIVWRI